ncbi:RICIN domain-containing protein [Streptomyces sp. NPDC000134]|uniref:RICIN domain-containing protein n=1 Tax=Streptomyces sp. NPDC000134 TaxID=3364536 RepID=UPI0036A726DC
MSLWTSLEPASATVDPGGSTRVRLRVRNTGDIVDEYRFEPVGDLAPWTTVEPPTMRLYPGTTGTVELTFAPPRTPDAAAGPNPYAVRITPTEHPDAVTVPEGNLTITPFTEVRAELVPPTVKGRFRGRPRLAVDNLGNTRVTASVSGTDQGDHLSYDIHPGSVQIEPGRAAFVKATLRPKRVIWFGAKEERPYTLAVQRSGVPPVGVDGTYVQRSFLPGWLATFTGAFMALVIAFAIIWLAYKPQVSSAARESPQEAGVALAPSPSAEKPLATPSPTPEPEEPEPGASAPAGDEDAGGGGGGGGGGGQASPSPSKKPKKPGIVPADDILLRNATTKKCADLPGEGRGGRQVNVQQSTCNQTDADNHLWDLDVKYPKSGPGGTPLFLIRNDKDGLCMDLPNNGAEPITTPITEADCAGTTDDNQLWWLDKQESGAYWVRNFASNNKCLDVAGWSDGGDGANLTLFDCRNDDDQEWTIVRRTKA